MAEEIQHVGDMTAKEAWTQLADWVNTTHPEEVQELYGRPVTMDDIYTGDCPPRMMRIVVDHMLDVLKQTMMEMQGPNGYNPVMARITGAAELSIIGFRWRMQIKSNVGPWKKWTTLTKGGWRERATEEEEKED